MEPENSRDTVECPTIEKWEARLLRVTAFAHHTRKPDQELWQKVIGTEPPDLAVKPVIRAVGKVRGGVLSIADQGLRIDFVLSANAPPTTEALFECIAEVGEAIEFLSPHIRNWLELKPELHRLAFGAMLLQRVSDRLSGYRALAQRLPHLNIPIAENVSDFSYQINRQRQAATPDCQDISINRLNKWSVVTGIAFFLSGPVPGLAKDAETSFSEDAILLEMDINTAREYTGIIPHERLGGLYQELVNLGREIADRGDIP